MLRRRGHGARSFEFALMLTLKVALQENLKHTLPLDIYDLIPDSSVDLRVGYQAQQLDWLSQQRDFDFLQIADTEDRPATLSSLPVRISSLLSCILAWCWPCVTDMSCSEGGCPAVAVCMQPARDKCALCGACRSSRAYLPPSQA